MDWISQFPGLSGLEEPIRQQLIAQSKIITVPAGTFDCVVIQPIIKSRGIFSEGGEAELAGAAPVFPISKTLARSG